MLLHENSHGVKMLREDKVKRSAVKVIEDGHTLHTYRFNNIPFYEHPYLSWANLDCCGGWNYDRDYLYKAVQEAKKLVAGITDETLPEISLTPDIEIWKNPVPTTNGPYKWWHMLVTRKGRLSDYFDIDSIAAAYAAQDFKIDKTSMAALEKYFSVPLIELFQNPFWVTLRTADEAIVAGLGLGYPIESTVSIIRGV